MSDGEVTKGAKMTIAERVADEFTQKLDLTNLTHTQSLILHAIRSVSMGQWARETLARQRGAK